MIKSRGKFIKIFLGPSIQQWSSTYNHPGHLNFVFGRAKLTQTTGIFLIIACQLVFCASISFVYFLYFCFFEKTAIGFWPLNWDTTDEVEVTIRSTKAFPKLLKSGLVPWSLLQVLNQYFQWRVSSAIVKWNGLRELVSAFICYYSCQK